jgi:hypothetical protein
MVTAQRAPQRATQHVRAPKILRIGVIQGGRIIEERLIKRRDAVSIGQGSRNTIIIPASNLPPSFTIFELKGASYVLRFTDSMSGRLSSGEMQLDFAALKAQGLAKRDRDGYAVPLTDQSKGKIALGEVTLLFQFVTPPPEAPKPALPPNAKGSIWNTMDRVFFGILAGVLLLNFGTVRAVTLRESKDEEEITLEELPDRFVKMIIPEKPKEAPKHKEEIAAGDGDKKEGDKDSKPKGDTKQKGPAGRVDAAARRAEVAKGVANRGLLKLLGAVGDSGGGGAIEDVLGSGSASADIASALAGAGGVGVATADGLASGGGRKGGGSGEAAGIGDLATAGGAGGAGALGEKKAVAITGRVIDQGPEIESSSCDRDAISRYVKRNLRAIQSCYERELKRNVSLKGKLVVRFTIGPSGRITEIDIDENSLGNDAVVACIKNTIRMWMFPIKDNECPVAYPFVFAPAS